jgi:hypothetical protein
MKPLKQNALILEGIALTPFQLRKSVMAIVSKDEAGLTIAGPKT